MQLQLLRPTTVLRNPARGSCWSHAAQQIIDLGSRRHIERALRRALHIKWAIAPRFAEHIYAQPDQFPAAAHSGSAEEEHRTDRAPHHAVPPAHIFTTSTSMSGNAARHRTIRATLHLEIQKQASVARQNRKRTKRPIALMTAANAGSSPDLPIRFRHARRVAHHTVEYIFAPAKSAKDNPDDS